MSGPKSKKRKHNDQRRELETSKPTAVFKPTDEGGRSYTLSIALPGSIIANALTHDQKTALVGQIARACAVFCVDEIVVFDDGQASIREPERGGYTAFADPNYFLFHLLTYLETPPHLRKALFPMHPDLRTAGALPSLDMPHHMKSDEWCSYREAVATFQFQDRTGRICTWVECGLSQKVFVPLPLEEKTRVTLQLPINRPPEESTIEAQAVAPDLPREQSGYYWGYSVRRASSLSAMFSECLFDGGYDVSVGTSERGVPISSVTNGAIDPTWNHLLIVFGGVAGIEAALSVDNELHDAGVTEAREIFDHWVNVVPGQGSRTIRTEEAVWVALMGLRPLLSRSIKEG